MGDKIVPNQLGAIEATLNKGDIIEVAYRPRQRRGKESYKDRVAYKEYRVIGWSPNGRLWLKGTGGQNKWRYTTDKITPRRNFNKVVLQRDGARGTHTQTLGMVVDIELKRQEAGRSEPGSPFDFS